MSLMYCGDDQIVTREGLAEAGNGVRMGSRHAPMNFHSYTTEVIEQLDHAGFSVKSEEYVLTKDKQTFFGMAQIYDYMEHTDFNINVGMRGSHVQKVSRGLLFGESVIVCSNLCFDGDLGNWKTKQTTNMAGRLRDMIREAVDTLPGRVEARVEVFDRLKDQRVSDRYGDAKLVDLYLKGGLSGNELPRAINEWHEPSFDHGSDMSLWRLFNAATQALKPTGDRVNMQTVAERSTIISHEMGRLVK